MPIDVDSEVTEPRELTGNLAGLSLTRQVIVLATWPLLEQFLSFLVGTVDLALAGRLAPESEAVKATDALGVAGYIVWLMGMIYATVGVGAAALIARAIGGRHKRLANAAVGQAMSMALFSGVLVGTVIYCLARLLADGTGLQAAAGTYCRQYLRIVALAAPPSALLMVGNATLRAAGDTRSPFAVMVMVNVLNIVLSISLVFGPPPIGGHGVKGIAIGTAVSWTLGAIATLTMLAQGWSPAGIRLRMHRLHPHWHTMRRILHISMPTLFESVVGIWLGNFIVLVVVTALKIEGAVGAHMIVVRIESASFLPGFAFSIAAATLCGQYLGLGDANRARQAVIRCWAIGSVVMFTMGLLFFFIPETLVRLITDAGPLVEQSLLPIRICGPIQIFLAMQIILSGALRGAGDTRTTMIISVTTTMLVRVPASYVLGITLGFGLNGIWFAIAAELVLRGVLFAWRFGQGKWEQVSV